jgi:hypothetical protein
VEEESTNGSFGFWPQVNAERPKKLRESENKRKQEKEKEKEPQDTY